MAEVAPYAAAGDQPTPLRIKTAIFMTRAQRGPRARHPAPAGPSRPASMRRAKARAFSYFVLSDTNDPDVAAAEEQAVEAWKAADPDRDRIVYRRRTDNTGYKAGNVRDFCARWGGDFALMLPLDADSLMAGRPDRAPGAHDAGPSQDRHPAEPGGRHAVVERVRAHLPVRHAPRHALLHHGPGLVGRRLRSVLGPQRAGAHQAVPRAVRPADPAGQAAARRPRALATTRSRPP